MRLKVLKLVGWFFFTLAFSGSTQSGPTQAGGPDDGQLLFASICASCHGKKGDGNGVVADAMILRPRDFALAAFKFDTDADWQTGTDVDLATIIKEGPGPYGGSSLMPAFADLTEEQVASLIRFIRSREGSMN